jgi:hypothetical protein
MAPQASDNPGWHWRSERTGHGTSFEAQNQAVPDLAKQTLRTVKGPAGMHALVVAPVVHGYNLDKFFTVIPGWMFCLLSLWA